MRVDHSLIYTAVKKSAMSRVRQIFLLVSDLDTTRPFYEDALGLTVKDNGDSSIAYETGDCELKIKADFEPDVLEHFNMDEPPEDDRGSGAIHVLSIEESLSDVYERMKQILDSAAGEVLIEPRPVPWGGKMFLARDPDGYVLEIRPSSEQ